MFWWFCTLLLPLMTVGLCHRQKKMMVMGAEGGRGTEERPCPVLRVPAKILATQPEHSESSTGLYIDYCSQASKALSERSPFDVAEETSTSFVPTLPNGLANFLNRHSDSRRRRKKSHSGVDRKSSRAGEKSRGSDIWIETEEYFRGLTLPDIDSLLEAASSCSLATRKYFYIPVLGNTPRPNIGSTKNEKETDEKIDSLAMENGAGLLETHSVAPGVLTPNDKDGATYSSGSLEWLLGCRKKVSLTSECPSKKRKLLGGNAGSEKVLIASPCDGDSSFCHYCSRGDTSREFNRLIICVSCKVAVHQKCYGVEDNVDGSWLCSWCKKSDEIGESANPCVLCPMKGGALKPVNGSGENVGSVEFGHLFCCLWMPEVYIEDLKKMEPVMNVGGIKGTRSKLVCHVCKVKCGACVQCSHGTCRASFHPICAREDRHTMEVWANYGFNDVELRAFCSMHSELQENNHILSSVGPVAVGIESSAATELPVVLPVDRTHNLKIGCKNGDNIGTDMVASDIFPDKFSHREPLEIGLSDDRLNASDMLESGGVQQRNNTGEVGMNTEDVNASDTPSFALVIKKLIDRGKVDAKAVALDIGISPDTLTAKLNESCMAPDLRWKIVNWLKAHVYTNACQKSSRVKLKPANSSKDESGAFDGSVTLSISDSDLLDPVAVKLVPPKRRTIGNISILKDNKVMSSSEAVSNENGMAMDSVKVEQLDHENPVHSDEASIPDATEMNLTQLEDTLLEGQGVTYKPYKSSFSGSVPEDNIAVCLQNASVFEDQLYPVHSVTESPAPGFIKKEETSRYIHPDIGKKLLQIHNWMVSKDIMCPGKEGNFGLNESSEANGCFGHQNQQSTCSDICKPNQEYMELLVMARKREFPESSPEDEMEGELIYFQHRLLQNSVATKQIADNLIHNLAKSLPQEIDAACQQRWDTVLVNQYLCDLREAKKQGRKERRHKEAQAVLAAATAAAAASSRVSSFRKDAFDESGQENLLNGRTGICSQPMPRVKETLPRVAVARTSSEKYSDYGHQTSDISKEHPRSCDICRRSETILNPILVCSSCKVAVHLDCYRSAKETMGPWYCELCEDLSSRSSGAPAVNFWEKPYLVAECGLCGSNTGAFRKSSDGQWVHAFCAEWVFEPTFQRGQVNAVEGMETVLKGVSICCICHHKHGVCIKCSYGHCQTTFHPSCARSTGFYMISRIAGGKMQHKAYCEKHGLEQRAKAKTQKHGIEELKSIKRTRVELERLRLLCERIVKREKIKRELVLCTHDILAFRRDHVARSVLVHSPFFLPDGSSESATTSLKENMEEYRSWSEAVQRSDDITVDSSVSGKHGVRVAISTDADPKLDDDCSTSQSHYNHKIPERMQFSGKQIPHRATVSSWNLLDGSGWRSKSRKVNLAVITNIKHAETFEKELVMTSDKASMKNLMLPKRYAYVPAEFLSNDNQHDQDVYASGPLEHAT